MDGDQLEPLDIDDRTGGERMIASGRAGISRLGELVDEQRLDIVALIWVGCLVAYTGTQIYGALDLFNGRVGGFGFGGWEKVAALASTGGPVIAISCVAGIALAFTSDTAQARVAIVLAGIVGAWVFVAGVLNVAYAFHRPGNRTFTFSLAQGSNRVVAAIGGLAVAGFGLVVMMIAWRAIGPRPAASPEVS
jgi:hypothetical protein